MSEDEEFGLQSPPPWVHLKRILANYPEGASVFKEALQNADDAGATVFKIYLDHRHHNCESLDQRFLATSLIFYNDALFSTTDWTSLRTMFQSHKADHVHQKSKKMYIGKYGMGSRSFFHLTDLLQVVSGNTYAYIDPDENLGPGGGAKTHFTSSCNSSTKHIRKHVDVFKHIENFDRSSEFKGTLFRLPLRLGRYARESRFAPYEYSPAKTLRLLTSFVKELGDCLLFLNHVSSIEVLEWHDCEDSPHLLAKCSLSTCSSMEDLQSAVANPSSIVPEKWTNSRSSQMLETVAKQDRAQLIVDEELIKLEWTLHSDLPMVRPSYWLIGRQIDNSAEDVKPDDYRMPLVGVAMRLSPDPMSLMPVSFSDEFQRSTEMAVNQQTILDKYCWPASDVSGGLFSFLPIADAPTTGLPFHVHGSFYLTDNRRDIWMSNEAEGLAQSWSCWNRRLLYADLPQLVSHLYDKCLIQRSNGKTADMSMIYRFWPDLNRIPPIAKPFAIALTKICVQKITEFQTLRFLRLGDTTLRCLNDLNRMWQHLVAQESEFAGHKAGIAEMLMSLAELTTKITRERTIIAPERFFKSFESPNYISFLTVMYHHVLPHWINNIGPNYLATKERYYVPWMYILCQTLSTCSSEEIQRFSPLCRDLKFIPCRITDNDKASALGVMPDENDWMDEASCKTVEDDWPLTCVTMKARSKEWKLEQPTRIFDTSLRSFKVTSGSIPTGSFATPCVSRVLRAWGMKPTLSWSDMTQELVFRMCHNV